MKKLKPISCTFSLSYSNNGKCIKIKYKYVKRQNLTKNETKKGFSPMYQKKEREKMDYTSLKEKMEKSISVYSEKLSEVRAGRANPAILNKVKIDYYGTPTPINQVAGISVPEARLIVIQPWDASVLKEIEKAILTSDIGINPNNDGKVIRLAFPELNEERRKELVKDIKKMGEEAKVAVRNVRREGIDLAKSMQKNGEMTEDELKSAENDIQKMTDKYIEEVEKVLEKKEKEVMSV